MNSTQLKWQKFAGYVLPMLTGWFLLVWLTAITEWDFNYNNPPSTRSAWQLHFSFWSIPLVLCWLALMPASGFAMGIANAYCWKNQTWLSSHKEFNEHLKVFLAFYLLTFVGLLGRDTKYISFDNVFMCFYGALWIFPIHFTCFRRAQELGKKWIETDAISRFLGKKNEWERDKSE